MLFGDSE
jgi:hypothetical protein